MSVLENNETRLFVNNEVAEVREDFYFQNGQKLTLQNFSSIQFCLLAKIFTEMFFPRMKNDNQYELIQELFAQTTQFSIERIIIRYQVLRNSLIHLFKK